MLLALDIEKVIPRTDAGWNRNRKRLVKLLAAANDLTANARTALIPYGQSADDRFLANSETRYFYRIACAHLHEALDAFEDCHGSGFLQRFRPFDNSGEDAVTRLVAANGDNDTQLRTYLARFRNKTFHYDFAGTLQGKGIILFGDNQTRGGSRFIVADDAVRVQTLQRSKSMNYEMREKLAVQFAGVIESVREEKWSIFCEAAEASTLKPYVALARMLVRIVEEATERKPAGKRSRKCVRARWIEGCHRASFPASQMRPQMQPASAPQSETIMGIRICVRRVAGGEPAAIFLGGYEPSALLVSSAIPGHSVRKRISANVDFFDE